jgi:ribosomal protein L11 methyltransferase
MGFGTGHHATTRLCLAALQTIDLRDQVVLDIGTGSGVLAMAAERLGAARATGIDYDPDAIQSARENLELNRDVRSVIFDVADLSDASLPAADVVTANLTGALLVRSSSAVLAAVRPGGTLILSGLLAHERDEVRAAFLPAAVVWEREEDGWVGLMMKKS